MAGAAPPAVYDDLILHISPDKVRTEVFHGLTLCSSVLPRVALLHPVSPGHRQDLLRHLAAGRTFPPPPPSTRETVATFVTLSTSLTCDCPLQKKPVGSLLPKVWPFRVKLGRKHQHWVFLRFFVG